MRIATWGLAAFAGVAAADVIPVVGTQDAISIPLPVSAPGAESLLLELDGHDITAVSKLGGGRAEIPLAALALAPGEHYLLIQSLAPNGDIDTLAEHTLDVFAREGVRASSSSHTVLLGTDYRLKASPEEDFSGSSRANSNAAIQWTGELDRSSWVVGGSLDVLFDSDRSASFDGDRWQLPGIDLRAGRRFARGGVSLGFGDAEPADDSLILSGFSRRGLRLEADAFDGAMAARLFTLHADPMTSFDAEVPPFDDAFSVTGAHTSLSPLPKFSEALRFTASWLDGDSTLGGAGIFIADDGFGPPPAVGGSAQSLAVDSLLLGRALWLRGEYADSRFDADGIGAGAAASRSDARRLVAQISSGGAVRIPVLEQWTLGAEHQRVGAHFYSLGNLLLPNDLQLEQLHASAAARGFGMQARWLAQHTDVDDEPLTPRIDSRQHSIALDYTPEILDPSAGVWRWLGVPTFRLSREVTDNSLRDADVVVAVFDLDNRQTASSVGVDFSQERFTVGFTFDQVKRDDRSQPLIVDDFVLYEPAPDSRERLLGVHLTWLAHERLSISPQWQRSRTRETGGGAFDNDLWALQLQAELIPQVLSAQLGWSESSDRQRFFELPQDAQRQSSSTGNLDLSYRMKQLTFHLRGAYGHNSLRTPMFQEAGRQWQAVLALEYHWEQP